MVIEKTQFVVIECVLLLTYYLFIKIYILQQLQGRFI